MMSNELKKGSMREVIKGIYDILRNDEILLRLLTHYPKSADRPHPLDQSIPNILDLSPEEYWDIVDDRILLAEKFSDIVERDVCRLYITQGRRRPVFGNYLMATQEIVISIYVHENYETDMRTAWLSDRINDLIALEDIPGIIGSKLEYVAGNPHVAPTHYKRFDAIYQYTTGKK